MSLRRSALVCVVLLACSRSTTPPATTPVPSPEGRWTSPPDTAAPGRARAVEAALAEIRGRETQPAESVYREIRLLKGVAAGRLLRVMDVGYGRSLGVGCAYCHVPGNYAAEDSSRKAVAREMWRLMFHINTEHLARIEGLRSDTARVNCTTCHRGTTKPALDLSDPPQRAGH
jgi:photosynthetic reaction center cytochrome c subunit